MPSSLLTPLFIWFYVICVMIVMKTQLLSAAQENCKDSWPNCHEYTSFCVENDLVKTNCKKSCELCSGTGGSVKANSGMGDGRSKTVSAKRPTPDNSAPAQANCKDLWPNCNDFTTLCANNDRVKESCQKTCGLCAGSGSKSQGGPGARPQNNASLNKGSQTAPSDSCTDIWPESKCLETADNCGYPNKRNCLKSCYLCRDSNGKIPKMETPWFYCKNEAGNDFCEKNKKTTCTRNSGWRCQLMCGKCSPVKPRFPPGLNTCKDTLPDCDKRKKYCKDFSGIIRNRCWKTCGFCDSSSGSKSQGAPGARSQNNAALNKGSQTGKPCDKVNRCRNGGTCSNFMRTYYCACPDGFAGKDCERKRVSICKTRAHECLNGSTCSDSGGPNFICLCAPGFGGYKCGEKNAGS